MKSASPFTLLAFLCLFLKLNAQDCSTPEPTKEQKNQYFEMLEQMRTQKGATTSDFVSIPLAVHIVRFDDGSGGIPEEEWYNAFERLNGIFAPAKVKFHMCGDINYINNSDLNDYDYVSDFFDMDPYYVDYSINVLITDRVQGGACGFGITASASYDDLAIIDYQCISTSVLEHEIGHVFGLLHTHESGELVARPDEGKPFNCDVEGDGFCDTPADPYPIGQYQINPENCVKEVRDGFATPVDANGDAYVPDQTNIMSYSLEQCRYKFSDEQIDFLNFAAHNNPGLVLMTCSNPPVSNFEVDEIVAVSGEPVQLFNRSTGNEITNFDWTFTNANISTSDLEDPTIIFNSPGTYDVTLETTNSGGSHQVTKPVHVVSLTELPLMEDFELGSALLTTNYGSSYAVETEVLINSIAGNTGNGLAMLATNSSPPFFVTAMEDNFAFTNNPRFLSRFVIPRIDARDFTNLELDFDAKLLYQDHHTYSNMRVLVNGTPISPTYNISGNGEEVWNSYNYDLAAFNGTIFDLTIEGVNKLEGNGVYVDNINLDGLSTVNVEEVNRTLSVYPNPSNGVINVVVEENTLIQVTDIQGRIITQKQSNNNKETINLIQQDNGVYFINLFSVNGTKTVKVMKR